MRRALQPYLLLLLALAGCTHSLVDDNVRQSDLVILDTVLKDLAVRDVGTYPGGKTVYVSQHSLGKNDFYLGNSQLSSDLRDQGIPDGIALSLRERNRAVVPIWDEGLETPHAKIGNYDQLMDEEFEDKDYPDCKLIATFWLPGYSTDGNLAMVRFAISPTAHGATATYLLRRDGESWTIEWFDESFYV
ncbi:hypothetical protein LOC71_08215 [Rhodopirellula sp. JC740]|uniref:Uncharacterized protein n=1 Tax=Rhodopirellula halodulae TaxID=2894198 RepID=A0ABS8NFC7_9BACT|nr:hypothetical protein [Rhodopirellula sp. JC740]MCC9642256.1 hypothetical protein [Rhodopirellula sp. JC740]